MWEFFRASDRKLQLRTLVFCIMVPQASLSLGSNRNEKPWDSEDKIVVSVFTSESI